MLATVMMLTMMVIVAGPASALHQSNHQSNGYHFGTFEGPGKDSNKNFCSCEPRRGLR